MPLKGRMPLILQSAEEEVASHPRAFLVDLAVEVTVC